VTALSYTETIARVLTSLADDLEHSDRYATTAPWTWKDGVYLKGVSSDEGVLEHGNVAWPMSPGNRSLIVDTRNRLPELVHWLREAAKRLAETADFMLHSAQRPPTGVCSDLTLAQLRERLKEDHRDGVNRSECPPCVAQDMIASEIVARAQGLRNEPGSASAHRLASLELLLLTREAT
jgi:hypothetical protein